MGFEVVGKSPGGFRGQVVHSSTSQAKVHLGTLSRYMTVDSMPKLLGSGICIPVLEGKGQQSGCYAGGQMTSIDAACIGPYANYPATAYSFTPLQRYAARAFGLYTQECCADMGFCEVATPSRRAGNTTAAVALTSWRTFRVRIQHPAHAASGLSFETGLTTQQALLDYIAVDDRIGCLIAKTIPNRGYSALDSGGNTTLLSTVSSLFLASRLRGKLEDDFVGRRSPVRLKAHMEPTSSQLARPSTASEFSAPRAAHAGELEALLPPQLASPSCRGSNWHRS